MHYLKKIFLLAVLAILPVCAGEQINISVLSFKINLNQFRAPAAIRGFTGTCKAELSRSSDIRVLERENLADITSEIALEATGLLKENSANAIDSLQLDGVDYIIGGEISQISPKKFRVNVFIREVKTARIVSEKIVANLERYPEAAAQMLAHNIACLLTGNGTPIEKKVMSGKVGTGMLIVGIAGIISGGVVRYLGEKEYANNYGTQDMPIADFDTHFNKAQRLTTIGEVLLGASAATLGTGIIITFSGRSDRTITRE